MIKLELTVARLIKTQEPVGAWHDVKTMGQLVNALDEVATPSACEYADVSIECDLSFLFKSRMGKNWRDSDDLFIDTCSVGWGVLSELDDLFNDESVSWTAVPFELNSCMGEDADLMIERGDIF
jgi:hypothetical protein